MTSIKRNAGLDILKCISAILIVLFHAGVFSKASFVIFRPAIMITFNIFAMITGFFHSNTVAKHKEKDEIKKIIRLIIITNLVYFIWTWLGTIIDGENPFSYLLAPVDRYGIINFIFFNESPFKYHLWYLNSILYVLIIVKIFDKLKIKKVLYYVSPILVIIAVCMGYYSKYIFGRVFETYLFRNFLFYILPFFIFGELIDKHKEKILAIPTKYYVVATAVTYITSVLEYNFIFKQKGYINGHWCFSTLALAVVVFILFYKIFDSREPNKIESIISNIGRKHSDFIYFWQYIAIDVVKYLFSFLNIEASTLIKTSLAIILLIVVSNLVGRIKYRKVR